MIVANSSTNGTINNNSNNTTTGDLQLSASSTSSSQANTPSSSASATTNASSTMTASTTISTTTSTSKPVLSTPQTSSTKPNAQPSTTATTNDTNQETNPTTLNGNSNLIISSATPSSSGSGSTNANDDSRWIFSHEKIQNSPSRADNISLEDELKERQEAALFITDLGAALKVNQLCINTAIIYMHRFFMIHSFKKFHRYVRVSLYYIIIVLLPKETGYINYLYLYLFAY